MLKPMFEGLQNDGPFGGGFGEDVWRSLQVQEFGKAIAHSGGIGLADAVRKELLAAQEARDRSAAMTAAPAATGETLLAAIAVLTDLLDQENRALATADRDGLRRLADEKHRACRTCEDAARALQEDATVLDQGIRHRLRPALARLADVSAVNRRRLAAALAAHRRLMELVADALRTRQPTPSAYAAGGGSPARTRLSVPPPALGFDRAL